MADGRKNNGAKAGVHQGQGRPRKDEEQKAQKLSLKAMETVFGSVEGCFEHTAEEAKKSYPHLRLLFEYAFGKPPQPIEGDFDTQITIIRELIK